MRFMAKWALVGTAVAVLASAAPASAQEKLKADVMHWWTSGGEAAAVKVFAQQYEKAGGQWVDDAVAGGENARAAAINRIIGGNPPTASQFNTGKQFDDLVSQGLLRNLDDLAAEGHWKKILPKPFLDAVTRDGHIYAVPVNIHGQNWMFWSKGAFKKAGIEGPIKTWDAFFTDMDKLKQAGIVAPLAQGGQAWQEHLLFNAVLISQGGKDLYLKVYRDKDPEAVKSDAFKQVVEIFGKMRNYVDAGSPNRNWNDATALLITDKGGVQFMGDWAKGEFINAGQKPGQDYGCEIGPGNADYLIGGDVFVFPKTDDPQQKKAQVLLAKTMISKETQIAFNLKKGSIPVRNDVDTSSFDACAQKAVKLTQDPSRLVADDDLLISADLMGLLDDVVTRFWHNKSETADEMISAWVDAYETAG